MTKKNIFKIHLAFRPPSFSLAKLDLTMTKIKTAVEEAKFFHILLV